MSNPRPVPSACPRRPITPGELPRPGWWLKGLVLLMLLPACQLSRRHIEPVPGPPPGRGAVVVTTVADERDEVVVEHDASALGLIPGVLYGEKLSTLHEPRYCNELPRVVAGTLEEARLFQQVLLLEEGEAGASISPLSEGRQVSHRHPGRTLWLRPVLHHSYREGRVYSYYLGPFFGGAWLLGLPIERKRYELKLTLRLEDPRSGEVLWHHKVDGQVSSSSGLFQGGHSFESASREIVAAALPSLERWLREQDDAFWERQPAAEPQPEPATSPEEIVSPPVVEAQD